MEKDNYSSGGDLSPNVSNQIVVSLRRNTGSTWQYLNGFILTEDPSAKRMLTQQRATVINDNLRVSTKTLISPNPVQQHLQLQYYSETGENVRYNVVDATGKVVLNGSFSKAGGIIRQSLSVVTLQPDIYLLQ